MHQTVLIDPFRCRMWPLHDRLESTLTEHNCKAEIDSFGTHGQLVPVLGRAVHGYRDCDVELIYGARRLFAARFAGKPLCAELRELSDREAIIAMDIENRHRVDISPYERGMSYARWLRAGYFQSQDDIAHALNVSASQVSRLIRVAHLPSAVVNAFGNPAEICESWALDLSTALEDPRRRQATLQRARTIAAVEQRPSGRRVYRRLLAAAGRGPIAPAAPHDDVIKDDEGRPLFRVRHLSNSMALLLPKDKASPGRLTMIRQAVTAILLSAEAQPVECSRRLPLKRDTRARALENGSSVRP
jgi:ParB family transcriptional regulator, chromosome partitioning protein